MNRNSRGFFEALAGDGRPLVTFTGVCLGLSGAFAILQSATGQFLPHDVAFLAMSAEDLCGMNQCRIVHFMFHDRVSFGGSLIALAALYFWLAEFPLRGRQRWAWWMLLVSGVLGFGSFLTYLGYGYLDTWHGAATLLLLPCFAGAVWRLRAIANAPASPTKDDHSPHELLQPAMWTTWPTRAGFGRACLLISALGTIGAGITIQIVGMTSVFVPSDLVFMGTSAAELDTINPRLIPLIAHDRAGFGGGIATAGFLTGAAIWFAEPCRSLWQALFIAGLAGWTTAIGIHPVIGYTDTLHLAPAVVGAVLYFMGLVLVRPLCFGKPAAEDGNGR
ncbi:MAG TPA: hypothetical protein VJ809_02825 [Pirellulales bacterium]|nr:hypothetical protein [Pirellulales bacterium]